MSPLYVLHFGGWRGIPRINVHVSRETYNEWHRQVFPESYHPEFTEDDDDHWWISHWRPPHPTIPGRRDVSVPEIAVGGWIDEV